MQAAPLPFQNVSRTAVSALTESTNRKPDPGHSQNSQSPDSFESVFDAGGSDNAEVSANEENGEAGIQVEQDDAQVAGAEAGETAKAKDNSEPVPGDGTDGVSEFSETLAAKSGQTVPAKTGVSTVTSSPSVSDAAEVLSVGSAKEKSAEPRNGATPEIQSGAPMLRGASNSNANPVNAPLTSERLPANAAQQGLQDGTPIRTPHTTGGDSNSASQVAMKEPRAPSPVATAANTPESVAAGKTAGLAETENQAARPERLTGDSQPVARAPANAGSQFAQAPAGVQTTQTTAGMQPASGPVPLNPAAQTIPEIAAFLGGSEQAEPGPQPEGEMASASSGSERSESVRSTQLRPELLRPESARMIGRQMIEQIQNGRNGSVEIALNPEELGRIRMTLTPSEQGMHLSLSGERAETLDLMRRHISELQQEFAALGYGDISFDFAGNEHSDPSDNTSSEFGAMAEMANEPAQKIASQAGSSSSLSGLDLRI